MVDMPDYAHPYAPNMLSDAYAGNALQGLLNSQKLQQDQQDAGQIAAQGDYSGAANQLMSQGHMAEAMQMQNVARTAKADKLKDMQDTYDKLGNLARVATTPDQWAQVVQAAKAHGLPVDGYDDFNTGRPMAIALSSKVGDIINEEKSRRDAELANFKASKSYKTTIPGEDGVSDDQDATVIQQPNGQWTQPVATPEGVDIDSPIGGDKAKSGSTAQVERVAKAYQDDWAQQHPDAPPMPMTEALNAAGITTRNNSGSGISFEPDTDGIPRLKTFGQEGTGSIKDTPSGAYNLAANREAGKFDTSLMARNTLGTVVQQHSDMLDKFAQRPDFNHAMEFLHTPDGARFWAGEALPMGTVPQTANDIRMTVKSLEHEYGNFVAAGHKGAMSENEGSELRSIVGQLNNAPDPQSFMHNVGTLRDLAGAFQNVHKIGPQSLEKTNTPGTAATSNISSTSSAAKQPHEMTDDELKKQLGL